MVKKIKQQKQQEHDVWLDTQRGDVEYRRGMNSILAKIKATLPEDGELLNELIVANKMIAEVRQHIAGLIPEMDIRELSVIMGCVLGMEIAGFVEAGRLQAEPTTKSMTSIIHAGATTSIPLGVESIRQYKAANTQLN